MRYKILYPYILLLTLTSLLGACSDDFFEKEGSTPQGEQRISFFAGDMVPQYVDKSDIATRAGDPKTEEEKKINTLHVFFFKPDGTLADTPYDNFPAYQKITGNMIVIPEGAIANLVGLRIVAIANINGTDAVQTADGEDPNSFKTKFSNYGRIESGSRDTGHPYEINTFSDLQKWVYRPKLRSEEKTPITDLPKAGMPMIGESKVLTESDLKNNIIVPMTALMARVDISVRLEPNQESRDGRLPRMTIESYGVENMPSTVPYTMPTGNSADDVTDVMTGDKVDDKKIEKNFNIELDQPVSIDKNTAVPATFTYYTYENVQVAKGSTDDFPADVKDPNVVPESMRPSVWQRWKPTIAHKDRASALVLNGTYTTHQNMTYKARFRIFMGENAIDDFKVKRNHKYNNYITIRGLDYVRNSDENVYTYDGRVNVVTDNPVYLAVVNERKIDAHASVLPMDVWLLLREPDPVTGEIKPATHESTVTIEIPEEARSWISMVMIPRKGMNTGTDEDPKFVAGTLAEPYFYENLIAEANSGQIKDHAIYASIRDEMQSGYRVEIKSTPTLNNSRSRIYFYIDENVDVNNPKGYGDRVAQIQITYSNTIPGSEPRHRTLEIEQRGLVRVDGQWRGNGGETATIPTTYMEYYEEYLDHKDPLDQHNQEGELYNGLNWGRNLMGVNCVYSLVRPINYGGFQNPERNNDLLQTRRDAAHIYYSTGAYPMTQWVINREGAVPMSSIKLFNDTEPASAFHYCYGKNKRNSQGDVVVRESSGWYMPGIRELERALVQHYLLFEDFQGNLYWSASCGQRESSSSNSDEDNYARATKVTLNSGNPTYINSSPGQEGYKLRTDRCRVRAFYKP